MTIKIQERFDELLAPADFDSPEIANAEILEAVDAFKNTGNKTEVLIQRGDDVFSLVLVTTQRIKTIVDLKKNGFMREGRRMMMDVAEDVGATKHYGTMYKSHYYQKVNEDFRGMGIGSLLRSVLERVEGVLSLEVSRSTDSIWFFIKRGYLPVGVNRTRDGLSSLEYDTFSERELTHLKQILRYAQAHQTTLKFNPRSSIKLEHNPEKARAFAESIEASEPLDASKYGLAAGMIEHGFDQNHLPENIATFEVETFSDLVELPDFQRPKVKDEAFKSLIEARIENNPLRIIAVKTPQDTFNIVMTGLTVSIISSQEKKQAASATWQSSTNYNEHNPTHDPNKLNIIRTVLEAQHGFREQISSRDIGKIDSYLTRGYVPAKFTYTGSTDTEDLTIAPSQHKIIQRALSYQRTVKHPLFFSQEQCLFNILMEYNPEDAKQYFDDIETLEMDTETFRTEYVENKDKIKLI